MNKTAMTISRLLLLLMLVPVFPEPASALTYDEGLKKARQQVQAGEYRTAERTLELLSKRFPGNPEIESAIGRIRLWQNDYKGAARFFRKALTRREDTSVRAELIKADAMLQLNEADRFISNGDNAAAKKNLEQLFLQNRLAYESGHRLGQLYLRTGQPAQAREVYLRLVRAYPSEADFAVLAAQAAADSGDGETALKELSAMPRPWQERSDVLMLKVRLLTGNGNLEEASKLLETSPQAAASPDLAAAKLRLGTLLILRQADSLNSSGRSGDAEVLLRPLWDVGTARYEAGIRLGRIYLARPDYEKAGSIYRSLSSEYPDEPDFKRQLVDVLAAKGETDQALEILNRLPADPDREARRGMLLFRKGSLTEAAQALRSSLAGQESPEARKKLAEIETALLLKRADALAKEGDAGGAAAIWQELESSGRDTYTAGYRLGAAALSRRDYSDARRRFAVLSSRFPHDRDFRYLHIESLILNKEEQEAGRIIESLSTEDAARLAGDRPDLLYRIRRNNFRLMAGEYRYSGKLPSEQNLAATVTQKIGRVTGVISGSRINRFGLTDHQVGLELHAGLGELAGRSGYLAATFSPDPSFSSRYTIGGEYSQPLGVVDASFGFFRMSFSKSDAHILIPGITAYPAENVSLSERVYYVADSGALTALTTLSWEPDHRFRSSLSIGLGNAAERITSTEDTTRYFTFTGRLSGEYRLTPATSLGGEFGYEYRQGLYSRTGASLFARYWW